MLAQTLKRMSDHAETIRNDAAAAVAMEVGDVLRQGDLYVVRVKDLPKSLKLRSSRQLADGDTQGSRHVLAGDAELFDLDADEAAATLARTDQRFDVRGYQVGPAFRCDGPVTIEHPEHGNRTVAEAGWYVSVFQRSLTSEEREERARD